MANEKTTIPRNEETLADFDYIAERLKEAAAYGLTAEVVTSAIKISNANHSFTTRQSMDFAMKEWDI